MGTPNPENLDVTWWSYLEDDETFNEHIEELNKSLTSLRQGINEEDSPLVAGEIDRVLIDIKELKELKNKQVDYTPETPLYLENYYLSDWLKISHKLDTLSDEMSSIRSDNDKKQAQIDLLRQTLDLDQIHYNVLDTAPVKRMLLGLEMMRLRLEIEMHEVQIKQNRNLLKLMAGDQERLEKEREFAKEKLNLSNLTSEVLQKQLSELKEVHLQAHKKLIELEKTSTEAPDKGLAELQVTEAKTALELAETRLLFLEIVHALVEPREDLLTQAESWKKRLDIIQKRASWIKRIVEKMDGTKTELTSQWADSRNQTLSNINQMELMIKDSRMLLSMLLARTEAKTPGSTTFRTKSVELYNQTSTTIENIFTTTLFHINDYPVTLWSFIRSLLIIIFFILIGKLVAVYFRRHPKIRDRFDHSNLYAMSKIGYYLLVLFGVIIAFFSLGFSITNFIIILGALGVGIGLGLQSIVNNFVSGIVILFEKRVRVGDILEIDKENMGPVQSINMQNTHLRTFDGRGIIIPNSDFLTKPYINWTIDDNYLRLRVPFGVAYGTDVNLVKTVVSEAAKTCPETVVNGEAHPAPKVWLVGFGDSSINFQLVVWVDFSHKINRTGLYSIYNYLIEEVLRENNIKIPFPQRDVWFRNNPDLKP